MRTLSLLVVITDPALAAWDHSTEPTKANPDTANKNPSVDQPRRSINFVPSCFRRCGQRPEGVCTAYKVGISKRDIPGTPWCEQNLHHARNTCHSRRSPSATVKDGPDVAKESTPRLEAR